MQDITITCDNCGIEQRAHQKFLEISVGSWLDGSPSHACGPKCQGKILRRLADQADPEPDEDLPRLPKPTKIVCYVLKAVDAMGGVGGYLWYVGKSEMPGKTVSCAFVEVPDSAMRFDGMAARAMARLLNTSEHRVVVVKRVRKRRNEPVKPSAA